MISKTEGFKSSVSNAAINIANWRFKYLIWLIFMFFNEYNMEFSKLTDEEEQEIISRNINLNNGQIEVEKSRVEAKKQLNEISDFILELESNEKNEILIKSKISQLSSFVKTNEGHGYEAGLSEIKTYKWFQWDLYYISDSFLMLLLFLFLSYDGNRYYYFGDLTQPLMFGLVRFAFKAAVLWSLYDFISNIFTRSDRIIKSEVLVGVVILYIVFIVAAIWEDIRNELKKRKETLV